MMPVKKTAALMTVAGVAVGGAAMASRAFELPRGGEEADRAAVVRVIDGDTLDVSRDGTRVRVRLLNVDTPETSHPDTPVECGGPEATDWLTQRLPAGTHIQLAYDVERLDRYGRELAWVSTADGTAINLEIARLGLGEAVAFAPNTRYLAQVQAAQEEARTRQVGLYDPEMPCVLPAQVDAQVQALQQAVLATDPTEPALASALAGTAAVLTALEAAEESVAGRMLGVAAIPALTGALTAAHSDAEGRKATLEREAEHRQAEPERAAAADRARADQAQSEAAERAAADTRQRESAAAERRAEQGRSTSDEAASAPVDDGGSVPGSSEDEADWEEWTPTEDEEPQYTDPHDSSGSDRSDGSSSSGSESSSGGGYPGYTGPRCYGPGGKVWHPC